MLAFHSLFCPDFGVSMLYKMYPRILFTLAGQVCSGFPLTFGQLDWSEGIWDLDFVIVHHILSLETNGI